MAARATLRVRQFDYNTVSDIVLHMRYTARPGGGQLAEKAVDHLRELIKKPSTSGLVQLLSLKHDFPTEWHRFVHGEEGLTVAVKQIHFPYFVQTGQAIVQKVELYGIHENDLARLEPEGVDVDSLTTALDDDKGYTLTLSPKDVLQREPEAHVFLLITYTIDPA